MRATIFALIPFIIAVTASVGPAPPTPQNDSANPPISKVKEQYPGSEIACCKNKEEISADGILGNILAKGLLNNVLGVGDSACAKFSLIENLNILGTYPLLMPRYHLAYSTIGFTKEGNDGTTCAEATAYCPVGEDVSSINQLYSYQVSDHYRTANLLDSEQRERALVIIDLALVLTLEPSVSALALLREHFFFFLPMVTMFRALGDFMLTLFYGESLVFRSILHFLQCWLGSLSRCAE
jgi:hypothetical protein